MKTCIHLICIQEINEILARQALQSLAWAKSLCAGKDYYVNLPYPNL